MPSAKMLFMAVAAVVVPALFGAAAADAAEVEEAAELEALASDESCGVGAADASCALNALQMRSRKQQAAEESEGDAQRWGYCASWRCGHYQPGMPCQCNGLCYQYGNCCGNYQAVCNPWQPPAPPPATPSPAPAPAPEPLVPTPAPLVPGPAPGEEPPAPAPAPVPGPVAPISGVVYGHPTPGKAYPQYPGFTLTLVEEFEAPIDLDSDPVWTWSDGGLVEGQIRFVKENVVFRDGKMMVEVRDQPAMNPQTCSAAEVGDIPWKKMTSGEMRTRHNMFRYGRYEARMKAPSVQPGNTLVNGNYVSTMFVYRDAKYKHWREIDFEITGDSTGSVTTNVLSADNTDVWRDGIQSSVKHTMSFNDRADFHDYAFEWTPHKITWYVDGKQIREYGGGQVPIPDLSGKIMMNMWMFDDRALFGGPEIRNNRYPMHSEYEWFRFYKWDGESQYPCPGLSPSCLTDDDRYLAKNNPCDGISQEGLKHGQPPCATHCP